MRILLLGEYSGLHTNLKGGLINLGNEVTLVSSGDGFKKFNGDIKIGNSLKNKYLNRILLIIEFWIKLAKFRNYDIVQFIDYEILYMPVFMKKAYIKTIKKLNKKVLINRCGLDAHGISVLLGKMRYSPFQNELKENIFNGTCKKLGYKNVKNAMEIMQLFDGIIVNTYEYYLPYENFKNYIGSIPLPLKSVNGFKRNIVSEKVNILYGKLRPVLKGHNYIIPALERIKREFGDSISINIVENLPFTEYNLLLDSCNILIDQANTYSYGMNALYALSKGKVVLSGNEKESEIFIGEKCPVINILPDIEDIYFKLKNLIDNPKQITSIGEDSYNYYLKIHECSKVGEGYIRLYNEV